MGSPPPAVIISIHIVWADMIAALVATNESTKVDKLVDVNLR
jgi:hypothetical protein